MIEDHSRARAGIPTPFGKRYFITQDICKRGVAVLALERGSAVEHFIDQDAQRPPVDGAGVAATFDHLGRDILLRTDERIRAEVGYARLGVDGGQVGESRADAVAGVDDHGGYAAGVGLLG